MNLSRPGRTLTALFGTVFIALHVSSTFAENGTTNQEPTTIAHELTGTNSIPLTKVPSVVLKGLGRQDVFDQVTDSLLKRIFDSKETTNAFLEFISDWHVRPKVFQATGSTNDATFGVEFNYNKSLASHVLNPNSKNPAGLALTLSAKGDVAIDAKKNPNNLIEAGGAFHLFQGIGGIDPSYTPTHEAQLQLQKTVQLAAGGDPVAYRQAVSEFTAHMRPHFFYDLQAHGTFETDQQFENKQWTYGGKASFVFRDWRARSDVAWFNVFDYPFAIVRALANKEEFQPSGRTFPSVLGGIDLVEPSEDKSRLAVDPNKDPYPRFRVEVAFKTPVMRWKSDNLYVSAAYRHFEEIGAPSIIRAANLDRSDYFVAKLDLPYKFNISYSTGKLPLDRKNDQVYAIGWNLNF